MTARPGNPGSARLPAPPRCRPPAPPAPLRSPHGRWRRRRRRSFAPGPRCLDGGRSCSGGKPRCAPQARDAALSQSVSQSAFSQAAPTQAAGGGRAEGSADRKGRFEQLPASSRPPRSGSSPQCEQRARAGFAFCPAAPCCRAQAAPHGPAFRSRPEAEGASKRRENGAKAALFCFFCFFFLSGESRVWRKGRYRFTSVKRH